MNPKALRKMARGLKALRSEARELATLSLCDGERIEAERALQRKAHVFVDDMKGDLPSDLSPTEQFRRQLQASLVATSCPIEPHRQRRGAGRCSDRSRKAAPTAKAKAPA